MSSRPRNQLALLGKRTAVANVFSRQFANETRGKGK